MKTTTKAILLIFCLSAVIGGALFGGYKWGYREGHQSATDHVSNGANIANCVYLTLASRKEIGGDMVMAHELRNRLLFASAMELDEIIDSGRLNETTARYTRGVVQEVVDHYWKHPEENSFPSQDKSLAHLKPKFTAFLQKYRRVEQVGGGQPATRPESK
ncbi:MAG: hypothetical protein JHD33_09285 [Chthoniobacterales bacterium]|nr:hypothetical protein [Chthoniobacterales bacterium]